MHTAVGKTANEADVTQTDKLESLKASTRSKIEHPSRIVKSLFQYKKVSYKALDKNTAQLHTLFALANLMTAKRGLLALDGRVAP